MAKNDKYFQNVKEALQKEGWITSSPLYLQSDEVVFKIDIFAERVILVAENKKEQIAVEVKSFLNKSFINDFHDCTGQYRNYVTMLNEVKPTCKLWLAVPVDVYKNNFTNPFITRCTIVNNMSIVTFDPNINRIIQWLPR